MTPVPAEAHLSAPELTAAAAGAARGWLGMAADLTRARLTALVLWTTVVGFHLGSRAPLDWVGLLQTLFGTALVAAGASALNQWWERKPDALMRRTRSRPLPSGRLRPGTVLALGLAASVLGLATLGFTVNPLTAGLGLVSLLVYVLVYTPLKRRTWLNTAVGTISGAMPVLMGWTAARGELTREGAALFFILVFWQLPHFLAIAWIYRDDYARAGYRMLSAADPDGRRSGRQAVAFALVLTACSVAPFGLGMAGTVYCAGAVLLGLAFVGAAFRFQRAPTETRARQLFRASIVYLPLLLILLAADKAG